MDPIALIIFLIIGLAAGWAAATLFRGGGLGLIGDMILGVVGAFVGGGALNFLGMTAGVGLIGTFVAAFLGALIILAVVHLVKRIT